MLKKPSQTFSFQTLSCWTASLCEAADVLAWVFVCFNSVSLCFLNNTIERDEVIWSKTEEPSDRRVTSIWFSLYSVLQATLTKKIKKNPIPCLRHWDVFFFALNCCTILNDWRENQKHTNSPQTGPSCDRNSAVSGTINFLYLQAEIVKVELRN